MGLEFIYGPASCHHDVPLVQKASEWLAKDANNEVFYLVPNHVKFETEVSVLENLHRLPEYQDWQNITTMRLQVFSFTRLAWYYLQHTALYQETSLSEAGSHMLIRKLLIEQADNLHVFRGEVNKAGFIKQLADLFNELQNGDIQETDLSDLMASLGDSLKEIDFKEKLHDFHLLYQNYLTALVERELGSNELLSQLAAFLSQQDLSRVMIIITGFSRFTAKEKQLIDVLIQQAAEVKINLILDQPHTQKLPERYDMFYDAGKLYFETYQMARFNQVKIYQDTRVQPFDVSDFTRLDEVWRESQTLSPEKVGYSLKTDTIQVWEGETPFAEVTHVAKEIRRLVATEGLRYQDIELLTRDMPQYDGIIGPVFRTHQIPYYLNRELEMKHHPLVEFLTTLFAIKKRYFRYTDVMRFLRTELFSPKETANLTTEEWQEQRNHYRDQIDTTENVVLAYGYEGFYWTQEKDWVYVHYEFSDEEVTETTDQVAQRVSNDIRNDIRTQLVPFYEQLDDAKTGREAAQLLYHFLITTGVEKELIHWRNQDIENGQLEAAKIHEQTWQAFIQLLDEYVEILGEDVFVLADFVDILTTGLEGLSYSKVPAAIDQVSVASLDLIHAQKNKVTFIIGATDAVLPNKIENKTLLSDDERSLVDEKLTEGKFLIKNTAADLVKEPYIAYLAFQSASERLYLTYPATSDHSKEIKISPYVDLIRRKLDLPLQQKTILPNNGQFDLSFIGTYRGLITDLNALKGQAKEEGAVILPLWSRLESAILEQPAVADLARKTFSSQGHQNIPETLKPETIEALYGETIYGSVSKIESFYQCQYKYFMNYGLKLKERDVFALTPAATGDFYHDALDQLFKTLIRQQLMLSELSDKQLKEITEEVLIGVLGESKFAILNASHRMNYIRYQLGQTIQRVGWALRKQSQRTGLTTVQTEVLFGQIAQQEGLGSLTIPLANQKKIDIRGKIDRLDQINVNEQAYLAVVDYKSSRHTFDYRDAYFGLTMQMITYLDVALKNAVKLIGQDQVKAAGAFYLQVKNPTIEGNLSPDQATEELFKEYGYKGLLLNEPKLLDKLDHTLIDTPKSSVFPYNMKKNGDYSSNQFVTEDELNLLMTHNRHNFKEAGTKIYQGQTKLNPAYRDKTRVACQYCPFRSVCQFDVMLKENEYHRIDKMNKDEVIAKIVEKEGGNLNDKD